jgi:predicted flap endonuclease-1-like 5' DNA nuclease
VISEQDETRDVASGDPSGEAGEGSLFSQLPRTRPGVRSPRRASVQTDAQLGSGAPPRKPAAVRAAKAAAAAADSAEYQSEDARPAPPRPREPEPEPDPSPDQARATGVGPAGLEDLAWAGIAVTAEAATLGVRLVGRAFDAARRAAERG